MNFKKIIIKNRTCYYFDDIIKIENFNLDNILIVKKSYENILVYNNTYKYLIGKPSPIRFGKIDKLTRVYDGTRCLVLFGNGKYHSICNTIEYLVSVKSGITYIICHNYAKMKVDSYSSLPLEKTMTFHNVMILNSDL